MIEKMPYFKHSRLAPEIFSGISSGMPQYCRLLLKHRKKEALQRIKGKNQRTVEEFWKLCEAWRKRQERRKKVANVQKKIGSVTELKEQSQIEEVNWPNKKLLWHLCQQTNEVKNWRCWHFFISKASCSVRQDSQLEKNGKKWPS